MTYSKMSRGATPTLEFDIDARRCDKYEKGVLALLWPSKRLLGIAAPDIPTIRGIGYPTIHRLSLNCTGGKWSDPYTKAR